MLRTKSIVLILVFTFCVFYQSFATVSILAVNNITKEIHYYDQEQVLGIFWVPVGDGAEAHYLDLGYTHTENPYALDNLLTLIIVGLTSLALFFLWKKNLVKRTLLNLLFYLHLIFALKYLALYSYRGDYGIPVSIVLFIIPAVIFLIDWMIEKFKVRRYSLILQVAFTVMFGYLLLLEMRMPN